MSQSAEASAETLPSCPLPALPHRQEAFARHVASGRTLTDAARLAGYAWDSARQTGSRLMKEPHIAARVADLTHAKEDQRQGELDELVSGLKRLMVDTMERKNDFAALRAIDMIARLRGLVPTTAKRSNGVEAALEEMRQSQAEDEEAEVELTSGSGCRRYSNTVASRTPTGDSFPSSIFHFPCYGERKARALMAARALSPASAVGQILEAGMFLDERELGGADGAVALFADDDLGGALFLDVRVAVGVAVLLGAVDEHHDVGVLFEGAGFAQVGELWPVVGAGF